MNIAVISGGSGNDALIKGLKNLCKDINVKVIVNAYDNGKSTGICRSVTDTLGVSDIRKNHIRMYKAMASNIDKRLVEFYDNRYSFTLGNEITEICELLDNWDLGQFKKYCIGFFNNSKARCYEYKDFSVANIIYSQMYKEMGYSATNEYFCKLLGLDNFVLLNSFDNVYIQAITKSGRLIDDEGDIVELKDYNDKIVKLEYTGQDYNTRFGLNKEATDAVLNADLIVISTGTFWSSIYPTLDYNNFYEYINKSKAKKIWVMNNNEDKDAYGVSSNDFIDIVTKVGLDLSDFIILENLDAVDILKEPNNKYHIEYKHMENNCGKHNGSLYAKYVLQAYFGILNKKFDKIILDFDDTIWARDYKNNKNLREYSVKNAELVNSLSDKACIISGNTMFSISQKLRSIYGSDLKNFNVDIWADTNAMLYRHGKEVEYIHYMQIDDEVNNIICDISKRFDLTLEKIVNMDYKVINYKIKNLSELEREMLVYIINDKIIDKFNCKAIKAGTTTVDIVSKLHDKVNTFKYLNLDKVNTLYIGDETDFGNDYNIAHACSSYISVNSIIETNTVLKIIGD